MLRAQAEKQLLAELVALVPARDRKKAAAMVAKYLAACEEIEEWRKEEARQDIRRAIEEMLADGSLVKDRDGMIRPAAHWPN